MKSLFRTFSFFFFTRKRFPTYEQNLFWYHFEIALEALESIFFLILNAVKMTSHHLYIVKHFDESCD